jgi:hypothetical protein
MIYVLGVLLIIVWFLGAVFVSALTGWSTEKTAELVKIIFWPITVFICKD